MLAIRENWGAFRELVARHRRFCSVMAADQSFNAFSHNTPALLLGGLIGQGAVGLFGMANRLVTVPANMLIGAVGRVALPALAGRPEEEMQDRILLALRGAAAFIPPVLLWLAFFAPVVVRVVLGRDYDAAAPLLAWLALNLLFQCLFSPISVIDVLRDRPDVTLAWNAACLAVRAAALWAFAPKGLLAALSAYAVASAAMWLVYGGLLGWLLRAGQARFFGAWARFAPLWGALALGFAACRLAAPLHPLAPLALSPLPAALYLAAAWWVDPRAAGLLRRLGSKA